MADMLITADQKAAFRANGYCVFPAVLSETELAMLSGTANRLLAEKPDDDGGGLLHDIGRGEDRRFLRLRHEHVPELAAFVLGDRIGRLAQVLLDAQPYLFVEQFVVKGPRSGAGFGWHQDSGYVGFDHRPYLTLWIAIDAATEENGCVFVLPRNLDTDEGVAPHHWVEANKERVGYTGADRGVALECPPGTIVAFSSTTMHRSGPNSTDHHRRAYVCQYSAEPIIDPETAEPKHFAKLVALSRNPRL